MSDKNSEFAERFHDELAISLDDFMLEKNLDLLMVLSIGMGTLHKSMNIPSAEAENISIEISSIMTGSDPYTEQDVANRFAELGYRVENGRIFYRALTPEPDTAPAKTFTEAELKKMALNDYIKYEFVYRVSSGYSAQAIEEYMAEYNDQNQYHGGKDAPVISLRDISDLSIASIVQLTNDFNHRSNPKSTAYDVQDIENKLVSIGFIVKDGVILHHRDYPPSSGPQP